jgi:hypothetical protein
MTQAPRAETESAPSEAELDKMKRISKDDSDRFSIGGLKFFAYLNVIAGGGGIFALFAFGSEITGRNGEQLWPMVALILSAFMIGAFLRVVAGMAENLIEIRKNTERATFENRGEQVKNP